MGFLPRQLEGVQVVAAHARTQEHERARGQGVDDTSTSCTEVWELADEICNGKLTDEETKATQTKPHPDAPNSEA